MKIRIQATLTILLAVLFFPFSGSAEDYYIMYDPSCMNRLEYAYGFTPDDQHYVKYHLKINATEVIVLEIGLESESPTQSYLNASTFGCGDDLLNRDLAERIRDNQDRVYMVRQQGNQYQISRANMASYFRRDNRGVVYDSWQFSFDHSGGLSPGDVLTDDPAKMLKVTYEGATQYKCTDAYKFRMEFSNGSNYRDLFFLPGIGIVEERPNSGNAGDIYKLKSFNDTPFETYLQKVCQSSAQGLTANFLPGGGNPTSGDNPNDGRGSPRYHEVEKGETAYSISRKYNISIDDLRSWNPEIQNASLVQVGDRIRVSPPEGAAGSPAGDNTGQPQNSSFAWGASAPSAGGNTGSNSLPTGTTSNNVSGSLPGGNMTAKGNPAYAWNTSNGVHTVQRGETVALLALKYGYTEERFRDMNNLGPNDIVKIGQQVKTTDCPSADATGSSGAGSMPGGTNPYNYNSGGSASPGQSTNPAQGTLPGTNTVQNSDFYSPPATSGSSPGSLPTGSTLPTFNQADSQGAGLNPRSPGTSYPAPGASATTPRNTASSSFEPYGTSGPDFGSLPPADNSNAAYTPETIAPGQGIYPNTDGTQAQPRAPQMNNYNSNSLPGATSTSGSTSSSFGTPIPTSGSVPGASNFNSDQNARAANGSSDPFSTTSYYSPDDTNNSSKSYQTIHTVREGDTLESIARKYNTEVEQLRRINNLERSEVLIPYQKLYIN